jgi:hypothetical protein
MFMYYVYSFFIGTTFVYKGMINESTGVVYSVGDILSVFTALQMGIMSLLGLTPNI